MYSVSSSFLLISGISQYFRAFIGIIGYEEKGRELIRYLRTTNPRKTALHDVLNDL